MSHIIESFLNPLELLSAYGWQCALRETPHDPLLPRVGMLELVGPLVPRALPMLRVRETNDLLDDLRNLHADEARRHEAQAVASTVYHHLLKLWGFSVGVRDLVHVPAEPCRSALDGAVKFIVRVAEEPYRTPLLYYGFGRDAITLRTRYARLPYVLHYLAQEEAGVPSSD